MQPFEANRWGGAYPDDRSAIADFTALLVRIATELVDDGMSRSYNQLREALLSNPEYVDVLPRVLREARTAGQFQAIVNREVNVDQGVTALVLSLFQDLAQRAYQLSSGDVRVTEDGDFRVTEDGDVRLTEDGEILLAEDGTPLLDEDGNPIEAEGTGGAAAEEGRTTREIASNWRDYFFTSDNGDPKEPRGDSANTDAASWTGVPSRAARLVAVRGQIEAAHEAIGYLIDEISADGGNGGPYWMSMGMHSRRCGNCTALSVPCLRPSIKAA